MFLNHRLGWLPVGALVVLVAGGGCFGSRYRQRTGKTVGFTVVVEGVGLCMLARGVYLHAEYGAWSTGHAGARDLAAWQWEMVGATMVFIAEQCDWSLSKSFDRKRAWPEDQTRLLVVPNGAAVAFRF